MAALIFERFGRLDARTHDVAVTNFKPKLPIVQRLLLYGTYALLEHAHLLETVEIVKDDAPVAFYDDDLPSLVRIGPAHMDVTDDVTRIAE